MKAKRGIYAAAVSPFDQAGKLNSAKLISYCQHLLADGGCDGVAPTGTTGEGNSISLPERHALPDAFAAAGIAADRVIFGTGACALHDAVATTRACLEAGYNNVLVLPPFYYKSPSDEGLYAHFARLIEQVGRDELRIYLYHFPQMSAVPFSPELVARLRRDFGPIIAGLKDSSGVLDNSRAFVDATGGVAEDFDVYPSSEAFLFDALDAGCAGIISGSTNAFAPLVQAALSAAESDRPNAFGKVIAARAVASKYPLMSAMKTIEYWRTDDPEWLNMATPLTALSEDQMQNLRADLQHIDSTPVAQAG